MTDRAFALGLAAATAILLAAFAGLLALFPTLRTQIGFLAACIGLYLTLSAVVYYTARPAARADNRALLAQYVLALTFVKMALSITLVWVYFSYFRPPGHSFLFPFFAAYLVYTLYETYVLLRLNRAAMATWRSPPADAPPP